MNKKTFIVAEIGINHNGKMSIARDLIDAAKEAGADAVKFQTFIVSEGHSSFYKTKSELRKEKREEFFFGDFLEIKKYCQRKKIIFFSTPFDVKSVGILERLAVPMYKIASAEIVNIPLLRRIARTRRPVIISTGMAEMAEIEKAVNLFRQCFKNRAVIINKDLRDTYGRFRSGIILLHCVSVYPPSYEEINLKCIETLKSRFKDCAVGFSDHTPGIEIPIAAVALGAKVIEKHFTLDKNMKGPDHKVSIEPNELKMMVRAIRNVERALGDGIKKISPSELKNMPSGRKSIVARKEIRKGEFFTEENLAVKRPAGGISPVEWDRIIGGEAQRDFKKDEFIFLKGIKEARDGR